MEPGESRPISLAAELPARADEWAAIVDRYALRAPRDLLQFVGYNSLVYADVMLAGAARPTTPILNSTVAIRQAGFHECMDTEDMFRKWFSTLVARRILPPANKG
jgi:hypothetical protein